MTASEPDNLDKDRPSAPDGSGGLSIEWYRRLVMETISHLINAEATLQPSYRPLLYETTTLEQTAQIGPREALS